MTNTKTTDITDDQIRALRAEAIASRDYEQADLCQRALAEDIIDQNGDVIAYADWTRAEARAECARVIAAAAAAD